MEEKYLQDVLGWANMSTNRTHKIYIIDKRVAVKTANLIRNNGFKVTLSGPKHHGYISFTANFELLIERL